MRRRCSAMVLFTLLSVLSQAASATAAETLKLAGTGGAMPMAQQVADAFDLASGIRIEVEFGVGSGGAIQAVADGAIDFAISARPLTSDEAGLGLTAVPCARTALVFVTSQGNPDNIASTALAGIFTSAHPQWSDGSPISIILRPESDSDSLLVEQAFPGMREAFAAARLRPDVPVASTDQDSATAAEELKGSLVQTGYSQIVTEQRNLRFVPIDGVAPTLENLQAGTYPYEKVFYLVYAATGQAAAERLLDFLRSDEGRDTLRATGNLPAVE